MASSRAPGVPPSGQVADFYVLLEKQATACCLSRNTRAAELSDRAAKLAQKLWGDSLVVADLRVSEATSLRELAYASKSSPEQQALTRNAWALLVPVHALLLRRLADNTLLPGTIKEEELLYYARSQAFVCKARNVLVPSEAVLQRQGAALGYATLLDAMCTTLALLAELRGSGVSRESAHSFVLTALDVIPRTAAMQNCVAIEANLVAMMETAMTPQMFKPSFCAAVLRKWRSSAVADVLRARGVLQTGVAAHRESAAGFDALQRADIEKIGLRECAVPSCHKVERTVREFKLCSGCRSVWYCSPEHHTLDWGAHKNVCIALDAERRDAATRDEAALEASARALTLE